MNQSLKDCGWLFVGKKLSYSGFDCKVAAGRVIL
jgi:hypothetical protein